MENISTRSRYKFLSISGLPCKWQCQNIWDSFCGPEFYTSWCWPLLLPDRDHGDVDEEACLMFFGVRVSEPHFQVLPTFLRYTAGAGTGHSRTLSPSFKSRNFRVRLLCLKYRSRNRAMEAFVVFSHRPGAWSQPSNNRGEISCIRRSRYSFNVVNLLLMILITHSITCTKPSSEEWNIKNRWSQFRTVSLRSNNSTSDRIIPFKSNIQVGIGSFGRSTHRFVVTTNNFFKFEGKREILSSLAWMACVRSYGFEVL